MYKHKLIQREQSSIINLRKFHNWTKRELLTQTCRTLRYEGHYNISLLDLSCGKGGDMDKWYGNNIMNVIGFDIDEKSIIEAKSRYQQLVYNLKKQGKEVPIYEFHVMDLSDKDNLPKIAKILNRKFNIVSCQFAIHYFFRNEESLSTFITIVGTYIENNGFFIGTTIDGLLLLNKLHDKNVIGNGIYRIEKGYVEPIKTPYNNTYFVSLGTSTDTEHYFVNKKSEEYIVDIGELVKLCANNGLTYVGTIDFSTWYSSFGKHIMSDDECEYSFLNFSFVFKKI